MGFILNNKVSQSGDGNGGFLNLNVSSAPTSPLLVGLLAYYNFNNNVLDQTGNGNNLIDSDTLNGNPCTYSSTVYKNIASASNVYNGSSSLLRGRFISSTTFVDQTQPLTISGWFNFSSTVGIGQPDGVYAMAGDSLVSYLPTIGWATSPYNLPDGSVPFPYRDVIWASSGQASGGVVCAVTSITPTTSTWYHVVLRSDPATSTIKLNVNAGTPTTATWSGSIDATPTPFGIFEDFNGDHMPSQNTNGKNEFVDELGVWQRLLTDAEVTSLYNGGAGKFYPFA